MAKVKLIRKVGFNQEEQRLVDAALSSKMDTKQNDMAKLLYKEIMDKTELEAGGIISELARDKMGKHDVDDGFPADYGVAIKTPR